MDSRKTASVLEARLERADGKVRLLAPRPGLWRSPPALGALIRHGDSIGELEELGRLHRLRAPQGAYGIVEEVEAPKLARAPVDHATVLLVLDPEAIVGAAAEEEAAIASEATGPVFRTPLGGRYYARPSPDADPFVKPGDRVTPGQTVALIEVMKTFNRVQYDGDAATVARIIPSDGEDVEADDVLLELEGEA